MAVISTEHITDRPVEQFGVPLPDGSPAESYPAVRNRVLRCVVEWVWLSNERVIRDGCALDTEAASNMFPDALDSSNHPNNSSVRDNEQFAGENIFGTHLPGFSAAVP